MAEKNLTGLILVNNSSSTVVLSGLTKDSINMLRTNTGGTDGTLYFNGKEYMTMETVSPHLLKNDTSTPLSSGNTEIVCDNIGWRGVTVNLTVNADTTAKGPAFYNAIVTASYDGSEETYTCSAGTPTIIEIPPYVDYTLTFEDKTGFITPDAVSGEGGRGATSSITATYVGESDMSMLSPLDGSIMGSRETANCYVLHKIGIYDIPLVYGCSISGDSVNINSFKYNDTYSATTQPFYNANNNEITSFVITKDCNVTNLGCEVLLNDSEDFIINGFQIIQKSMTIDGVSETIPCIRFNCTSIPTLGGNITLALKNNDNNAVLWSWHLWGYPQTLSTIDHKSLIDVDYEVLNVDLGWCWYDEQYSYGYAPYYQWGRKDPMLRYGAIAEQGSFNIATDASYGLAGAIINANYFFINNGSYGWLLTGGGGETVFLNYWNWNCTSVTGDTKYSMNKTIYDPCPRGFGVPCTDFFNDLEIKASATFKDGYEMDGRYYYTTGYRHLDSGAIANTSYGYFWTNTPSAVHSSKAFKVLNGSLEKFATGNVAFGCHVVPIRKKT